MHEKGLQYNYAFGTETSRKEKEHDLQLYVFVYEVSLDLTKHKAATEKSIFSPSILNSFNLHRMASLTCDKPIQ
jgi:hypothetical protein